jgi:dipeptidyl aminopeptidase/acylaminoacyl peptidase
MAPLKSSSRAVFAHIRSIPLLGCALISGLVATDGPVPNPLAAQVMDQTATRAESPNYRLAARFAPYKIRELIHSTSVEPNWIEGSERFWYSWETGDGKNYYLVDPQAGTRTEIFDNDRIAAELTRITLDPWDGKHLPIRSIRFMDENTLQFEVVSSQDEEVDEDQDDDELEEQREDEEEEGEEEDEDEGKILFHFEYDVTTRTLRELADWEGPDNHPSWASVSPDGQTVVYARNHNLQMMSGADYAQILDARRGESGDDADEAEEDVEIDDVQLTTDGEEDYSYAANERGPTDTEREEDKDKRKRVAISWSKDSRRFAMIRQDRRMSQDLWVIHSTGNKRPELETYKYDLPGDTTVSQPEILIYDLPDRSLVKVNTEGWEDQRLFLANDRQFVYPDSEEPRRTLWLSEGSDELHFLRRSRDQHRIDVMVADASTGDVRVLIEERLNTYVENRPLELLASGDLVWWSERDGWAHLYVFGADGTLRHRLTEGAFSVRNVVGVDEAQGTVYFMANAREAGEDPYYQHLYQVSLEGTGLQVVDPGDFDHRTVMGESNRFFVDSYSRVNSVPASALYDVSGRRIMDLEVADFSALTEAGYQFPEPYTVKAADGITDLYGIIYRPFDFDPEKSYPIIAYVYPGPQTEAVSKFFSTNATETALAQLGFIVITIGNRGGHPARSKWYHNYGYGNLRDYGLGDKKAAIEQLADRYDYIDIDRVGIYGHSGGGFMSTAAMLVYPDFFKVAVSSSGNHDNDVYNANWSEKHDGIKEIVDDEGEVTFEYDIDRNSDLADNLKGHLLLTTGDEDNNVNPAGTLRMADALIKANKRFDFFVFPGQRHGYGDMGDYWFWLRAEYFADHLLGNGRWNADIAELQVEKPKTTKP